MKLLIGLFLIAYAGKKKADQDLVMHEDRYQFTLFHKLFPKQLSYFSLQSSWVNKYKNWPKDQRAKFPGAKTFLVALTDFWHLSGLLRLSAWQLALAFYIGLSEQLVLLPEWQHILIDFLIIKTVFSSSFQTFYSLQDMRFITTFRQWANRWFGKAAGLNVILFAGLGFFICWSASYYLGWGEYHVAGLGVLYILLGAFLHLWGKNTPKL